MSAPSLLLRLRYALGRWLVAPVIRLPKRMVGNPIGRNIAFTPSLSSLAKRLADVEAKTINPAAKPCPDALELQRRQLEAALRTERLLSRLVESRVATRNQS